MSKLDGGRYLSDLYSRDSIQATFLDSIIRAINKLGTATGADPVGDVTPPPPVNAITIKASGELIHATLSHAAVVTRAINYFLEADTSPSFTQPHVMDLGSSRTHVFHLPTFDDAGGIHNWYFRAYAQYPGSKPSKPTVLGGLGNPTAVKLQGPSKLTLLPSTGSGTASPTGQQGGQGRGKAAQSSPKVLRIGRPQGSQTPVVNPSVSPAQHLLAVVNSASFTTAVTQSGTSTALNVASGTFYIGSTKITTNAGSVDPGAYGTFYVYHDDPYFQGGNVVYQVTSDITQLGQAYGRFVDGKITTTNTGGGSGGGTGGGGGGRGFL